MADIQRADSIAALREAAKRRLPRPVFDFFDGGADAELTLARNLTDLARIELAPRVLRDVSVRDSTSQILGRAASLPLIVAPTGLAALGWPRADILLARAAGRCALPFVISTSSSVRLEDIAAGAPDTRLWFQVYVYKDRELVRSLVARAKAAGVEALVLTVDTPVLGWRRRDHANHFTVPLRLSLGMAMEFMRCWRWTLDIARFGAPKMQNFVEGDGSSDIVSLANLMAQNIDASVSWQDVDWLRSLWQGPLILKGLSSEADIEEAVRRGIDAVWISNHGGRQLDGASSTISRLAPIASAAERRLEIYLDGGIRNGADIVKTVALGATAAAVGRATLFGVSAGGEAGADRALTILRDEFDRCLALMGVTSPQQLDASCVRPPADWAMPSSPAQSTAHPPQRAPV